MLLSVERRSLRGGGGLLSLRHVFSLQISSEMEPLGCCHAPCGLLVVFTPLYGSCRPWVIDRLPLVACGCPRLGRKAPVTSWLYSLPSMVVCRPWVIDCSPPLVSVMVIGAWQVGPPLALHDGLQDSVIPSGLAGRSTCPKWVPVWFYIGVTACNVRCGVPSYLMLLIGLCQLYRLYVCQYGVFNLKLILSYLPVQLTYSLPSSPLIGVLLL